MTHGTNSTYVGGCRCMTCTRAAREYLQEYRRGRKAAPRVGSIIILEPERRVSGISGMTSSTVNNASGVRVWCRCGNTGYANKWIVGKTRKIDSCEACR